MDRLPQDPLVIKPVHEIGKYGGTWRRGFTGPGDDENGNRIRLRPPAPLRLHGHQDRCRRCAKGWKMSEDGKTFTLYLRRGMKWSDGKPFTADDFVFWFEDIYQNKDLVPTRIPDMMTNGKPGRIVKVDDYTVHFEFPEPYYLFPDMLAGDTRSAAARRSGNRRSAPWRLCARHYLKQFHPKYVPAASTPPTEGQGRELRQLGRAPAFQEGLDAQPGAAVLGAVEGRCSRSTSRPG